MKSTTQRIQQQNQGQKTKSKIKIKTMNDRIQVTELNNRGIILLHSRNYNEAISVFRRAFDITSKYVQTPGPTTTSPSVSSTNNHQNFSSSDTSNFAPLQWIRIGFQGTLTPSHSHAQSTTLSTNLPSQSSSLSPSDDDVSMYIYQRALMMSTLQTSPKESSSSSRSNMPSTQETAIILFNLALASHLYAISMAQECGDNKAKCMALLKMALTVYGQATMFLRLGVVEENSTPTPCKNNTSSNNNNAAAFDTNIFTIASLNNVGQIHYVLGQYNKAMSCFEYVSRLMTRMDSKNNHKSSSNDDDDDDDDVLHRESVLDESERNGILLNIITLKHPTFAIAPAA